MTTNNNAIVFTNPGTLDKRAFTVLGLSAKEGDEETKIGFFGTGFKYALAILLREGLKVYIYTRKDFYNFALHEDKFRNKKQTFIICEHFRFDKGDNKLVGTFELPFTTHLGHNWKVWQAYRELYTNAIDEGGTVHRINNFDFSDYSNGGVAIAIVGKSIEEAYDMHDKYFLNPDVVKPICHDFAMRALEKVIGSDTVYYKSMYTGTKLDRDTLLTYDYIRNVELTEERALKDTWSIGYDIARLWTTKMTKDDLMRYLPLIREHHYEHRLSSAQHTPGDDFMAACKLLLDQRRSMPLWAMRMYTNNQPISDKIARVKLNKHENAMLKRAFAILSHQGVIFDRSKVIFADELPDGVLGYFDSEDQTIYIARSLFEAGLPKLVGTLFEEWLHMAKQADDCTRDMQNLLIDKCAVLMERLYDADNYTDDDSDDQL